MKIQKSLIFVLQKQPKGCKQEALEENSNLKVVNNLKVVKKFSKWK